jgi:hypothetical protein
VVFEGTGESGVAGEEGSVDVLGHGYVEAVA